MRVRNEENSKLCGKGKECEEVGYEKSCGRDEYVQIVLDKKINENIMFIKEKTGIGGSLRV